MPVFFENNKVIIAARIITETHEITMKKNECDWHKLSMCEDGTYVRQAPNKNVTIK